jgi:uncharacterized protein YndB with AHSA1/START domain
MTSEITSIQREIFIEAPRSKVWHALTTPREFSNWFSAEVEGPFEVGKRVDLESSSRSGKTVRYYLIVERIKPEHTFAWKWHPGSADPIEDESTLVEFHLKEVKNGTVVTVTETGFDRISLSRRAKAFEENCRGWDTQLGRLEQYASQTD